MLDSLSTPSFTLSSIFFKIIPRQLMLNSWRFLLILLILSTIYEPPFHLDFVIFLHFYYLKNTDDTSYFSF